MSAQDPSRRSAGQSRLTGPEALPTPPSRYVATPIVANIENVVTASVLSGGIALIDGPVGIGKTTAVVEAARNLTIDAVYVNMVGTDTLRDELSTIWKALTGTENPGKASAIRGDIQDTLTRRRMLLVIDDAHHVKTKGLSTLTSIWNRVHNAEAIGTPIVLCGNNLGSHLSRTLPELLSRADAEYEVKPLAGRALLDTVMAMEPTIAGTNPDLIRDLNKRYFQGELRRWNQFFTHLANFRSTEDVGPLTDDDVERVLRIMPRRRAA